MAVLTFGDVYKDIKSQRKFFRQSFSDPLKLNSFDTFGKWKAFPIVPT